jgi:hypothetical protein
LLQAADPAFSTRSKEFEAVENSLYEVFLAALTKALAQESPVKVAVAS